MTAMHPLCVIMMFKSFAFLQGERRQFTEPGQAGKVSLELYTALTDIQTEKADDPQSWVYAV